ncbi:MAG: hypothetical protein OXN97_10285 [Bryobacterales bacterium]|nr:hypothetical protein [Bryobacterales bacterium]
MEAACVCWRFGTTEARTLIDLRLDGHIVGEVAENDGGPHNHGASQGAAGDPVN